MSLADVSQSLWNDAVGKADYLGAGEKYQEAILEQYKMFVEMADRISARRNLANTFFLTLNTLVITAIGLFWKDVGKISLWLVPPLLGLTIQCAAWFVLLHSYRQLNVAKYLVIGALEERLPASPYWRAEWTALATGTDRRIYWPMTHLEQLTPALLGVLYVAALFGVVIGTVAR